MELKMYKIRNKETGEFSKGGTTPSSIWTKGGKTWTNIGHVKTHLSQWLWRKGHKDYPYDNAEIVEIVVDVDECFAYDVSVLVDEMAKKKVEQEIKREELHEKWIREQDLKQLEALKKKYEV